jgi:hypothetical protein
MIHTREARGALQANANAIDTQARARQATDDNISAATQVS